MSQGAAASIRLRLKRRAEELGLDLQTAIQYYAIERFLYRLSRSRWADRFVVKGATMLRVWDGAIARPTRDVDLLGRVPNSPNEIRAIIAECLAIESDDGIVFSEAIEATAITFEDRYPGVRVKGSGSLAGARFVLWLDIGIVRHTEDHRFSEDRTHDIRQNRYSGRPPNIIHGCVDRSNRSIKAG